MAHCLLGSLWQVADIILYYHILSLRRGQDKRFYLFMCCKSVTNVIHVAMLLLVTRTCCHAYHTAQFAASTMRVAMNIDYVKSRHFRDDPA